MSSTVPTPSPQPAGPDGGKTRFTWGLILDVFDVLNRHGYTRHSDQATGAAVGVLIDLSRPTRGDGREHHLTLPPGQQRDGPHPLGGGG